MKKYFLILFIFISCIGATCKGNQADNNLTAKNYQCENTTDKNAMSCCMQGLSSATGSDSKDAICRPVVDETANQLRQNRLIELYRFCQGLTVKEGQRVQDNRDFFACWSTLGPK